MNIIKAEMLFIGTKTTLYKHYTLMVEWVATGVSKLKLFIIIHCKNYFFTIFTHINQSN